MEDKKRDDAESAWWKQGAASIVQSENDTLGTMLAYLPASLPELDDPHQAIIAYADIAAQLDAFGLTPPDSMDDEEFAAWASVTMGLPLPSPAAQYLQSWRDDFGFDLLQTDQTLSVSLPPFELSLHRGRFDENEIVRTLRELGYKPVGSGDRPILAIRGDCEQAIDAPTAYKFAAMNYATILDDGTLAFASAQAVLEAVLEVEAGEIPSLAEWSDIAALLPHAPEDLASALFVHGVMLAGDVPSELLVPDEGTPDIDAIATEMAGQNDLPPMEMALLGTTAGGSMQGSLR